MMETDSLLTHNSTTDLNDAFPDQTLALSSASPRIPDMNSPLIQGLSISLSGDSEIDYLIHHYGIHITDLLQPISHVQNTYRELYLPTALEGTSSPMLNPDTPKAMAQTALYHALLSASAYHIWNCDRNQTKYQSIGAKHRHQAHYYLQFAVNTTIPGADYKLFMIAILSLVTIGVSEDV
jgi:arginine metabolism regulation protein II